MTKTNASKVAKLLALVAFLGGAAYFKFYTEAGQAITFESVVSEVRSYAPYDRLAYIVVYMIGTVILAPGTALSFAGAILFGVWWGTLWTWIGATLGASLSFFVAKLLGRDFVAGLFGGRFDAFEDQVREHGFTGLLFIRLLPIFPFNGVNFGAGLTSIRFRDYFLATVIGILPGVFLYQYLFATVGRPILKEGLKWEYLRDPYLYAPILAFVAFAVSMNYLSGVLKRRWRQDESAMEGTTSASPRSNSPDAVV